MNNPDQKTVLVTGAEGALGSVVVERLLAGRRTVIATYHHHRSPTWPRSEDLLPIQMDVTRPDSIRQGIESLGCPIDAWLHCAGGFRFAQVDQVKDEDLAFLLEVNFRSAFLLARELVPAMKKRGFGRIVLVSSKATLQPGAGMGLYAASKAALNMLTLSLAEEVKGQDITVNAVLPTVIDTPANRRDMPGADFSAWVSPQALADFMISLIEPGGRMIHGALIPVAGRV